MDSVLGIILWWLCGVVRGNEGTREQGNGAYPMFPVFPMFPMFPMFPTTHIKLKGEN